MRLTARGLTVMVAGLVMWIAARVFGSPGMEVVAIGLAVLPFISGLLSGRGSQELAVRRRLAETRVEPGTRVTVAVDLENRGNRTTSFLLLEDSLPVSLGRPARMVTTAVHPRSTQRLSYTVQPQIRGRYRLGPLTVDASDPYLLTRQRMQFPARDEILVTPEIEDLRSPIDTESGMSFGASRTRQLFRTGEEFYTMRAYQQGDDLRRLHWPSVARTAELMIRQDETSRRAGGMVFLDNRAMTLGKIRSESFERAVSVAASIGVLLTRAGFTIRLATAELAPALVNEERFLDALAGIGHAQARSIGPALAHLRQGASPDTSLVLVAAPPMPEELTSLIRSGSGFGPRLAVFVYPIEPTNLPPQRQAQLEGRATQARLALMRAGWDCLVLSPSTSLKERWHTPKDRLLVRSS
jgi:uncharacterized protein (DUF58 family)